MIKSQFQKIMISLFQHQWIIVFCIVLTSILTLLSIIYPIGDIPQKTKIIRLGTGNHNHEYFLRGMDLVTKLNDDFNENKINNISFAVKITTGPRENIDLLDQKKIEMAILSSNIYAHGPRQKKIQNDLENLADLYKENFFLVYRKDEYAEIDPDALKKIYKDNRLCLGQSFNYSRAKKNTSDYGNTPKDWWAKTLFYQLNARFDLDCQFNPDNHLMHSPDPFKALNNYKRIFKKIN